MPRAILISSIRTSHNLTAALFENKSPPKCKVSLAPAIHSSVILRSFIHFTFNLPLSLSSYSQNMTLATFM